MMTIQTTDIHKTLFAVKMKIVKGQTTRNLGTQNFRGFIVIRYASQLPK